jgi:hypothetical protein
LLGQLRGEATVCQRIEWAGDTAARGKSSYDGEALQSTSISLPFPLLIHFLQVRWTQVPDLVNKRRVLLKDGWAYVPSKEQLSIVLRAFEANLENALDVS